MSKRRLPCSWFNGARLLICVLLVGFASPAQAGSYQGEVVLDYFRSQSRNDGPGAGTPAELSAQDLGSRFLVSAREGRFSFVLDYHGREALSGDVENSTLRLLYAGYLEYEAIPGRLHLKAGRFLAPSTVLLPVDAVGLNYQRARWKASLFGGRRGVLTSRRNVPFDEFLPAAGGALNWQGTNKSLQGVVAYAEEDAILLKGGGDDQELDRRYGSWNGYIHGWFRPRAELTIVGRLSMAERAGFVLGPDWEDVELDLQALDLFNGSLFVEYRPNRSLRWRYDVHTQRASVYRQGLTEDKQDEGALSFEDEEPKFTDHRLRATVQTFSRGWVRAEVRLRSRPERNETRFGAALDLHDVSLGRLFLRGRVYHDVIDPESGHETRFDVDRTYFSGSVGMPFRSLETEIGVSRLRREASPYSGRTVRNSEPDAPTRQDDLGLFTLETDSIAFLRLFYVRGLQFAGADFELNLDDRDELRLYLQLGTRWERRN